MEFVTLNALVRMTLFIFTMLTEGGGRTMLVPLTMFVMAALLVIMASALLKAIGSAGARKPVARAGNPPGPVGKPTGRLEMRGRSGASESSPRAFSRWSFLKR